MAHLLILNFNSNELNDLTMVLGAFKGIMNASRLF